MKRKVMCLCLIGARLYDEVGHFGQQRRRLQHVLVPVAVGLLDLMAPEMDCVLQNFTKGSILSVTKQAPVVSNPPDSYHFESSVFQHHFLYALKSISVTCMTCS